MAGQDWRDRTIARLLKSEAKGVAALSKILPVYDEAERAINKEIQSLYANYGKKGILSVSDLEKALTETEKAAFMKKLDTKMRLLGLKPEEVFDERYLERLTRLEALKAQAKVEVMSIAPQEVNISETTYRSIGQSSYAGMQGDISTMGITPAFATLDTDIVDIILRSKWYGGNYSSRIWTNTDILAQRLPIVMASALSSGQSYQKTARLIADEFAVSHYNASRLVRTESNYFHNQAELQSYIDDGITEYDYDAVMDGRTSRICRGLNNSRFKIEDAQVGKNYPPMHVHCRSTTAPVFPDEPKRVGTRAERTARYEIGQTNAQIKRQFASDLADNLRVAKPTPIEALASKYSGNELIAQIDKLIQGTEKGEPTRPALVKAAELYGWRPVDN